MPDSVGVTVTLKEIYDKVQRTDDRIDKLTRTVEEMVAINRRLDQHHDRLNAHSDRIRKSESQIAAQWIIVGIVTTVIGAALVKAIIGG